MKGLKLGLLYALALAVVIWLVFFQLKPTDSPFANLRPSHTELTGIRVNRNWTPETDFAVNFAVLDASETSETTDSWAKHGMSVRGHLTPPAQTSDWQQTLTRQVVSADFPVMQFDRLSGLFDDLTVLNKFLVATKGSGEETCRFLLTLDADTPVKMVHLSGWDGFIGRLPEAGFAATFLAASHFKNQVRGRQHPAWFELSAENPAALPSQLAAALMHHELTGFQLDLRQTSATPQVLVFLHLLQQLNFIADFDFVWYSGTRGVGVLVSKARFLAETGKRSLAEFTAQTLLRGGMPVEMVPLERCYFLEYLEPYRILLLNYQDQYPTSPVFQDNLAKWVRRGGTLIFHPGAAHAGDFWWQQQNLNSPAAHLFGALKLDSEPAPGVSEYGKGRIIIAGAPLNTKPEGAKSVRKLVQQAVQEINLEHFEYREQNYLYLKRGPFIFAAVLENAVSDKLLEIPGSFIDCGTGNLALTDKKILQPGEVALLYNLKKVERLTGKVLMSASAITAEKNKNPDFSFTSRGPAGTPCHTLVKLVAMPPKVEMTTDSGQAVPFEMQWAPKEKLLRLIHENQGEPVHVRFIW